jgi:hypothetical protein
MFRTLTCCVFPIVVAVALSAQDVPAPVSAAAPTAPEPAWVDISAKLGPQDWSGHGLWTVAADPYADVVYAAFSKMGVWSSRDGGATWTATALPTDGIAEQFIFDPAAPEHFWASGMYGFGICASTDGAKTIAKLGNDGHVDGVAVDLSDPARKTMLCGHHETIRSMHISNDGGATWRDIGKLLPEDSNHSTWPIIIDSKTMLMNTAGWLQGKAWGIFRSADAGASWTKVSDFGAAGQSTVAADGTIYWSCMWDKHLIKSSDQGQTWTTIPGPVHGTICDVGGGRIVGMGGAHLYVSSDHGATWSAFGPLAPFVSEGLTYQPTRRAFFIWRQSNNRVPDAVMRYDLPPGDAAFAASTAGRLTVWDGEGFNDGKGWMGGGTLDRVEGDAHSGNAALDFHIDGGKAAQGGWNWHNWAQSGLTDIREFSRLVFWAKLTAPAGALDKISVCLNCGPNKTSSRTAPLATFAADLSDGAWHEVAIPLSALIPAPGYTPETTYELRVLADLPAGAKAELLIDDISFDNQKKP